MFQNLAIRDFSQKQNREWIEKTLEQVKSKFPVTVPPIVNGSILEAKSYEEVTCPSNKDIKIARYAMATVEMAEAAVKACEKAKETWGRLPVSRRCDVIDRVADLMEQHRNELVTIMVLEVGKDYREADADACEAIDFCRYYAQEMRRLADPREMAGLPGESNEYSYVPRGLSVAISPWNFPLAILCGMAVGPLVCGNPVIMKPAEQSSAVALRLYEIIREAGVPAEAVHLLPGQGEVVGAYLVRHPKVHIINFTGSKAVGLEIFSEAAKVVPGQKHVKKVLAEMGGKNAMIIDDDADLDEAVMACLQSGFSFQGQKCSALSRLFVHESCYDKFKERFVLALDSLKVGPSYETASRLGPVIDRQSQERLLAVIERNKSKIVYQKKIDADLMKSGNYVPPTIFEDSDSQSELGQNEFFGPLVCLFKFRTFEEAVEKMNSVDYALTGGLFSRSPTRIKMAREQIEVGNLYINRGITGALVCRQPFGGFKLSGVGAKAGGPDYLLQFLEPRTITENTMRRGFAPEV